MQCMKMAGAFNSEMEEFMTAAAESYHRYETNLDSICAKYGHEFPDSDVICMKTGTIVNTSGTVKRLKPIRFGEAKLAVTKRRADKLMTTLSQSNFEVTSRPADCQSLYSHYVNGSVDQSHFADDASKILSFIKEDEHEPSDAETISSRDSSNALEISDSELSNSDSYQDEIDGDLDLEGRSKIKGRAENMKEAAWYSLGSSSGYSNQESDTSCEKVYGSSNSRSKDMYSKNEDSESTDGERRGIGPLSTKNVEKNRLLKRQEGDSGFESGPGRHLIPENKNSVRLFCLNEDKINRVMNWVKNQAQENTDFHPPPESFCGEDMHKEQVMSPKKIRKTGEPVKSSPFKESNSKWLPPTFEAGAMDETYTVPKTAMSPFALKTGPKLSQADILNKENKTVVIENSNVFPSSQTKMFESTLPIADPDEIYETQNESGFLTPRRIVRARKRAFTPIQPAYTSEQLLDYLMSPMPKSVFEVLSPSRQKTGFDEEKVKHVSNRNYEHPSQEGMETPSCISQPDQSFRPEDETGIVQERLSEPCQPIIIGFGARMTNFQNFHLNNLNKNVTTDYNSSNSEVKPRPQIVTTSEFMTSAADFADPNVKSCPDDGITLCDGFGQSAKNHDHVVSEIPQTCRSPAMVTRSGGLVSKKQIFDRLKLGGCASEPKSRGEVARTSVRARRQLGWNSENPERSDEFRHRTEIPESNSLPAKRSENEERFVTEVRNNRREEIRGSEKFAHERRAGSKENKKENQMMPVNVKTDRYVSLEEARAVYQQDLRQSEGGPENMDICSEASPEEQRGYQTRITSRHVNGYSSDPSKGSLDHRPQRQVKGTQSGTDKYSLNAKSGKERSSSNLALSGKVRSSMNITQSGKDRSSMNVDTTGKNRSSMNGATSGMENGLVEVTYKNRYFLNGDKMERCSKDVGEKKRCSVIAKSEKKAREVSKDNEAASPVSGRKPVKILSASGLSPSTGLSQLCLGSPTQPKPHRKSSKELFNDDNKLKKTFVPCFPSSVMSRSNNTSGDLFSSPRKSERTEESLRKSLFGSRDVSLTKQRDLVPNDLVLSPRKQNPKRVKDKVLERDYFGLGSNSPGGQTDDDSPFKQPLNVEKRSTNLHKVKSQSQAHLPKTQNLLQTLLEKSDFQRPPPGDTLRKWKSSQDVKSSTNYAPQDSKICEKDLFLVPNGPSLKPIMSRKKKKVRENRYDHTQTDMRLTSVHSMRWTSTPAKGRNVPILNDSMSTIFQGFEKQRDIFEYDYDDDEDEVQTVSPHSFISEN